MTPRKYSDSTKSTRPAALAVLLKEKGVSYFIKKTFYLHVFRHIKPLVSKKAFTYDNTRLRYNNDTYNNTFANERTVEIPIVQNAIKDRNVTSVLEIGNVLSHYTTNAAWTILDKYEIAHNVINEDIVDFQPPRRYEFIFSISTLEHVGFDESPQDRHKILSSISHIKNDMLADGGTLLVTFPLGWNPSLDAMLKHGKLKFDQFAYYKRKSWTNSWVPLSRQPQVDATYGTHIGADYLVVAIYTKSTNV